MGDMDTRGVANQFLGQRPQNSSASSKSFRPQQVYNSPTNTPETASTPEPPSQLLGESKYRASPTHTLGIRKLRSKEASFAQRHILRAVSLGRDRPGMLLTPPNGLTPTEGPGLRSATLALE